ncbi:MAG: sulfatase-like hydrolase/transferase, partial [Planctomycetes bacterium]|nr:sulfatase-like hydrolase/transferase [Planctomycetota bacterium]
MHNPRFRLLLSIITLVVCLVAVRGNAAESKQKPNILFIFADDQCYETIHAFGHTEIETPNLDRLAKRGLTFTRAYNMGSWSGAVCVASRTMLNTGRFLWHANAVYGKQTEQERQAGRFWSEHMKKAGYDTYFTGKWHVRADANKAFLFADHVRGGMPNQT